METRNFMSIVLHGIKDYVMMTIGMLLYSFGWLACILPTKSIGGGATGLCMVVHYGLAQVLPEGIIQYLPVGVLLFIVNGILLVTAGFIVGWNFGIKTIYCITVLSFFMSVLQSTGICDNLIQLDETILQVVLGGVIAGIGVAMSFRQGGSTGGTDIVAMIINKFRTISYGRIVMISDFVIISSSLLIPDLGIRGAIYGFVFTAVFGYTVDLIMAGNSQSTQIFIISHDYQAMADAMLYRANRGATVIDARGWYSKNESKIVMVVCRKRETSMILKIVKSVDPNAFISAGSVMGVYGKGFNALNKV